MDYNQFSKKIGMGQPKYKPVENVGSEVEEAGSPLTLDNGQFTNLSNECYNNLSERDKYFKLLTLNKKDDLEILSKGDEIMEDAANKIVSLSNDPGFISELEKQQIEEYAREVALNKKITDEKNRIAKKMLDKGSDIDFISECTGLSIDDIEKLQLFE